MEENGDGVVEIAGLDVRIFSVTVESTISDVVMKDDFESLADS